MFLTLKVLPVCLGQLITTVNELRITNIKKTQQKKSKHSIIIHFMSHLRTCAADLADVTVVELRLLWRPFGLLQLVLVKGRLFVHVSSWGCHHVAPRVAPGGAGQLFEWRVNGRLRLLELLLLLRRLMRRRMRLLLLLLLWLGESLLSRLVKGRGGRGGVASRIITGIIYA